MAEGLFVPLVSVVRLCIEEPYKIISNRVASSITLEDRYDQLNQELQKLHAIQEDNESQVQRHKQEDTTMVYHLWKKRVSNIVAEVGNLRVEYDRKRLPKWDFIQRSILSEKITKRQNKVTELSEEGRIMNVLVDYKQPEAVLRRLATLGPVKRHGIEEPYPYISIKFAFSKKLEAMYDQLNQELEKLVAIKEDNERKVQRHQQNDTTMVYQSWKKSVSNIAEELNNLRAEYERKRLPRWRFDRRSHLIGKITKRHNKVKELSEEGLLMNILVDNAQRLMYLQARDGDESSTSNKETSVSKNLGSSNIFTEHKEDLLVRDDDKSSNKKETSIVAQCSASCSNKISPNGRFGRIITNWEKGAHLGRGSFGSVYEGISGDGFFFAVKEVSLLDQGPQGKQSVDHLNQARQDESKLYIFLELVTKGSLASLYRQYTLRDSQVSAYTRQILHGLKHCCQTRELTLRFYRVYVFTLQKRVNSHIESKLVLTR